MKINRKSKTSLRKIIEEKLRDFPMGERIRLDKEVLEELLFDEIILDSEKGIRIKLPVWSGDFLKKIDLSEVDFTDVSWKILDGDMYSKSENIRFRDIGDIDSRIIDRIRKIKEEHTKKFLYDFYRIKYDGTNANIDLTQSFEAIHGNCIQLSSCNFKGLDFSGQDLSKISSLSLINSSIAETKLPIPKNMLIYGDHSSFQNIDLSNITIDFYPSNSENSFLLKNCNLCNTGIHIIIASEDSKEINKNKKARDALRNVGKYNWIGCYVNGIKILSAEEKKENAAAKKNEYISMIDDLCNSLLEKIDDQAKKLRK